MYEFAFLPLIKATWETIYMVFIASFISIVFGLLLGSLLYLTGKKQALENTLLHRSLGLVVNVTRSVPFIILMISIIPLTRFLIGTTIGTNAAIVPLAIAAIPFFARITENALAEVSFGLIEAANAMGASTWQTVNKILLPESLPALIRGATLTIIGLIGYSAMAGVVGGGGLGELAINYGYQQFDVMVMFETVIVLIIMVQVIQMLGDWFAKKRQIKSIVFASLILWIACFFYQTWPTALPTESIIKVGVMSGAPEKIMRVAQKEAQEKYGIHLQIVTFSDYVQPNTALNNGSIDANIFQHAPYLTAQAEAHAYKLATLAKTFVYPMGFYSQQIQALSELKNGAIVAIPNDPSNAARALLLLQKHGLIKLKTGRGTLATLRDVEENPRQLQFKSLDAAQLPRVLKDAALVAITNDFIEPSGFTLNQAILKEGSDSPYANLIVVREQDKTNTNLQILVKVMHSNSVLAETKKVFPHGGAIPAW